MTLPDERYRAVVQTGKFLEELIRTPGIPKTVKDNARWCLRHYPSEWDMEYAAKGAPHVFAKTMEDVQRMMAKYQEDNGNANQISK